MSMNLEADASPADDQKSAMERMYRLQRHFYDATRAYYLLGRDQLINRLSPPPTGNVLEIGCGTGRNLVRAAQLYPGRRFHGIDISDEMLKTACASVTRLGLQDSIHLAQADATTFEPGRSFGCRAFDRIFVSYTLSMIPEWQAALLHASTLLGPGGELHVVDFGRCEGLPKTVRQTLYAWLSAFGVTPRQNLEDVIAGASKNAECSVRVWSSHRGYAVHASLHKLTHPAT